MAEHGRYFKVEETENATAQIIGNTLADLADILVEGPPQGEEDKIAIIRVPADPDAESGTKEARDHFELGEAGQDIPGEEDQLVAADGEGKAKPNEGLFFSSLDVEDKEADPLVYIAKLTTPLPILEIEGQHPFASPFNYWGKNHDRKQIHLKGNPIIRMDSAAGSPIVSMQGTSIIEMNGDGKYVSSYQGQYVSRNSNYLPPLLKTIYGNYNSPFDENKHLSDDGKIYPYLHMSESSTLIMEGSSMIKTAFGSLTEITGNVVFKINGASTQQGDYGPTYNTTFLVHPYSFFRMGMESNPLGGSYGPLFSIESGNSGSAGQIILSAQNDIKNISNSVGDTDWRTMTTCPVRSSRILGLSSEVGPFERNRVCIDSRSSPNSADFWSYVFQPTLIVEGRTNIRVGDAGIFAAKIGPTGGGVTTFDWTDGSGSTVDIKLGAGASSQIVFDVGDNGSSRGYYKLCPEGGSSTVVLFEPHSRTSINFAPAGNNGLKPNSDTSQGHCGIDFTPYKTDFDCRWYKLNADIQGNDAFIHTTGDFHIENHEGTFILRCSSSVATQVNYKESDRAKTHLHKLWQGIYATSKSVPTLQLYDNSNLAMYGDDTAAPLEEIIKVYIPKTEFPTAPTQQEFEASTYYQTDFIDKIPSSYIYNGVYTYTCASSGNTNWLITCNYTYTYTEYISELPAATTSPVLEMRSASELRIRDGAYIKAQTTNGVTTITFGSNKSGENDVSFTLAELEALKNLLTPV